MNNFVQPTKAVLRSVRRFVFLALVELLEVNVVELEVALKSKDFKNCRNGELNGTNLIPLQADGSQARMKNEEEFREQKAHSQSSSADNFRIFDVGWNFSVADIDDRLQNRLSLKLPHRLMFQQLQ